MALPVLDGNGLPKTIKTTLDGPDHVAHHRVDSVAGDVAAIQSGTWNVGVTSIIAGTGAANVGKAEDAAHTSADVGVMALSVQSKTVGSSVSADGDYAPLTTDGQGRLMTQATQSGDGITISGIAAAAAYKRAFANVAASQTDAAVIAAVATKKLRVLGLAMSCGGPVTFNSKPAGAGSAISATFAPSVSGVFVLPETPAGWFETAVGEGLSVTTGAGSTVPIQVIYVEI